MNPKKNTATGWRHKGVIAMILFLWPVCAPAQEEQTDVVYLKNGSIIYGSLVPARDSDHLALRAADSGVWIFARPEVMASGRAKTVFPAEKDGWYNSTSLGLFFGDDKGYQLETVAGYHFLYRYYVGAGAAIDDYTFRAVPVFASFKADLRLKKTTPFVYLNAGATYAWPRAGTAIYGQKAERKKAGPYLDAGIGQKLWIDPGHSIHLSLGYSREKFDFIFKQRDFGNPEPEIERVRTDTYRYTFNRLVLKVGFTL